MFFVNPTCYPSVPLTKKQKQQNVFRVQQVLSLKPSQRILDDYKLLYFYFHQHQFFLKVERTKSFKAKILCIKQIESVSKELFKKRFPKNKIEDSPDQKISFLKNNGKCYVLEKFEHDQSFVILDLSKVNSIMSENQVQYRQTIAQLKKYSLFGKMQHYELEYLANYVEKISGKYKQFLYVQGQPVQYIYFLQKGQFQLSKKIETRVQLRQSSFKKSLAEKFSEQAYQQSPFMVKQKKFVRQRICLMQGNFGQCIGDIEFFLQKSKRQFAVKCLSVESSMIRISVNHLKLIYQQNSAAYKLVKSEINKKYQLCLQRLAFNPLQRQPKSSNVLKKVLNSMQSCQYVHLGQDDTSRRYTSNQHYSQNNNSTQKNKNLPHLTINVTKNKKRFQESNDRNRNISSISNSTKVYKTNEKLNMSIPASTIITRKNNTSMKNNHHPYRYLDKEKIQSAFISELRNKRHHQRLKKKQLQNLDGSYSGCKMMMMPTQISQEQQVGDKGYARKLKTQKDKKHIITTSNDHHNMHSAEKILLLPNISTNSRQNKQAFSSAAGYDFFLNQTDTPSTNRNIVKRKVKKARCLIDVAALIKQKQSVSKLKSSTKNPQFSFYKEVDKRCQILQQRQHQSKATDDKFPISNTMNKLLKQQARQSVSSVHSPYYMKCLLLDSLKRSGYVPKKQVFSKNLSKKKHKCQQDNYDEYRRNPEEVGVKAQSPKMQRNQNTTDDLLSPLSKSLLVKNNFDEFFVKFD